MNYSRHYRRPTYFSLGNVRDIFFSKTTYVLNYLCSIIETTKRNDQKKSEKLMQINCLAFFFTSIHHGKSIYFSSKTSDFFFMHHCTPTMQLLALSVYIGYKKSGGSFFPLWFITVFFYFVLIFFVFFNFYF